MYFYDLSGIIWRDIWSSIFWVVLRLAAQAYVTLCDPMGYIACQAPLSMGILQARLLEEVAMPSSRKSSQPRDRSQVSHIEGIFFTIWTTRETQEY